MDNGLIFPYPRRNAHAEPSDANRPNTRAGSFEGRRVGLARDPDW